MKRIYLASRYSRREELEGYSRQLRRLGYYITSQWLLGAHEKADGNYSSVDLASYAREDLNDIDDADTLILFNDGEEVYGKGGRHVEFGYALAAGEIRRVILIGKRENVFHYLPEIEYFATWGHFMASLPDGVCCGEEVIREGKDGYTN